MSNRLIYLILYLTKKKQLHHSLQIVIGMIKSKSVLLRKID